MDYSPRYDSVTTLTRELPEDWRPVVSRSLTWVTATQGMDVTDVATGGFVDAQPDPGTYTTIAGLVANINTQLAPLAGINDIVFAVTGTGEIEITGTADFTVTWFAALQSMLLQNVLGFTANLAGGDTYTGPNVAKLPMVPPEFDVSVYDLGGTALDTGTADCPGWYLTTASVNRGARTVTCSADGITIADWEQGRRALLYSDTGASAELVTVEAASLTGSVWTLSFRERFGFPHAAGIYVIPWWITYDLDATDETVFTLGNKGTVVWTPTAVWDYPDLVDTWFTREMLRDLGATEAKFKAIFPRVHGAIRDAQDFAAYVADAQEGLRQWLAGHGQDIDALTDRRPLERLLLREVAWTVASQAGEDLAGEFERLEKVRAEARQDYAAVLHAQDVDQNHIITEKENSAANQPMPMRVW